MSIETDPRFKDTVSAHLSGDDDLDDLETNGKGLVVRNPLKERAAYIPPKIYCTRCQKGIHNISENDQRCLGARKKSRSDCQCACQTHYVGRDGRLRKHGTPDDSKTLEDLPKIAHDPFFEKINKEWHEAHGTAPKPAAEQRETVL